MQRQIRRVTALMLLGLLTSLWLGGCSRTVRETPVSEPWPELESQAEECTGISGRYNAKPRIHGKAVMLETPLLAYTLLPFSGKLATADRIDLNVTETSLTVTALSKGTRLVSHVYHTGDRIFECIAGSLEFRPLKKTGSAQTPNQPGLDWETVRLRRTVDGSLLLQKADGLASLAFMLFPIYFTSDHWYLFKPAE